MKRQTKIWKTRDGRRIRICDMTDSHLDNTIALLEKRSMEITERAINSRYDALSVFQGEMATYYLEGEIAYLERNGIKPEVISSIYPNLILEKERRKKDEKDS